MGSIHLVVPQKEEPPALHERAMDNLKYIRETMERATAFTGISGWGQVAIGVTALGRILHFGATENVQRLAGGLVAEAVIALLIAGWSMDRKARAAKMPLLSGPGRKVAFSLSPPIFAGGIVTVVLYRAGLDRRDSRSLVVALRNRRGYRRHVFSERGSNHGSVFHGARRGGVFRASRVCQLVYGSRLWRTCILFSE